MRIRLGQLEFFDLSPDELDDLIQRYGQAAIISGDATQQNPAKNSPKGATDGPRDLVLLRTFIEAGMVGVSAKRAASLLGRGGKAMRGAAREWAVRVGLTHDSASDPFDDCRIGTARGIRIKSDLVDLAKELLRGG